MKDLILICGGIYILGAIIFSIIFVESAVRTNKKIKEFGDRGLGNFYVASSAILMGLFWFVLIPFLLLITKREE